MNEYPAVLWRLLGLIDDCQHDLKWSDISDELHGNALQIGLYRKLIETDSQKQEGPIIAVLADSPEATERIAAFFASMNPTLWLSKKGRYELAMHRETEAKSGGGTKLDTTEKQSDPPKPKKLLKGWHAIAPAVGELHSAREEIKRLNKAYDGPITTAGRGSSPKVYKEDLIEWWNSLATKQQELANQREGRRLSANAQYAYGKNATVAPEISGSVKKRRKPRRT